MKSGKLTVKIYVERNGKYYNSYLSRIYETTVLAKLEWDRLVALVIKLAIINQKHISRFASYDPDRKHMKYMTMTFDYINTSTLPMKEKVTLWVDDTEEMPTEEVDFKSFLYSEADRLFDLLIEEEKDSV